jgi:hypothetical protein
MLELVVCGLIGLSQLLDVEIAHVGNREETRWDIL